jgi:hypothetical protein
LRGRQPLGIHQQRTGGPGLRLRVQDPGQQTRSFGKDLSVFMQEEDILAFGAAHAQIEGLGQTEIARNADEPRVRENDFKLLAAVRRTVVHHHDLDRVAAFGALQCFKRAP